MPKNILLSRYNSFKLTLDGDIYHKKEVKINNNKLIDKFYKRITKDDELMLKELFPDKIY